MRIPVSKAAGVAAVCLAAWLAVGPASAQEPTEPYSGGVPQATGRIIEAAPVAADDPALAQTGSEVEPLAIVAVGLLAAGGACTVVARRRRTPDAR